MNTSVYWDYYDNVFSTEDNIIGISSGKRTRTTLLYSLNYLLTPDTSAFAQLRIQNSDADRSKNDFRENRISVGLQRVF